MRICVIGAGAMGGSFAVLLARAGHELRLIDTSARHVQAITAQGLHLSGRLGDHDAQLPASTEVPGEDWVGWAEWVVVFTDSNATAAAAATAARVLGADGCAVTMQNGIGNVEALVAELGEGRVMGGSSMCSAALLAPGHVALTHLDTTTVGELDGSDSARLATLVQMLETAGLPAATSSDVMAKIWHKFVLNCGINALCATTGLRCGEMTRVPELYALQDRIIAEALAVVAARGLVLPDADVRDTIQRTSYYKFNKPSMLQHVEAGKRTEIDAINGALVREARRLGIPVPYNEALVALLKGREQRALRDAEAADIDYAAWEARVRDDPLPD